MASETPSGEDLHCNVTVSQLGPSWIHFLTGTRTRNGEFGSLGALFLCPQSVPKTSNFRSLLGWVNEMPETYAHTVKKEWPEES